LAVEIVDLNYLAVLVEMGLIAGVLVVSDVVDRGSVIQSIRGSNFQRLDRDFGKQFSDLLSDRSGWWQIEVGCHLLIEIGSGFNADVVSPAQSAKPAELGLYFLLDFGWCIRFVSHVCGPFTGWLENGTVSSASSLHCALKTPEIRQRERVAVGL